MGIIRRQSIYSSIFTFIGFAIGAVNLLVLFKHFLTTEQLGLTTLLLNFSILFATFCTLGSVPTVLKFYPFYKSYLPEGQNDLPFISAILTLTGIIIFAVVTLLFKDFILRKFGGKSQLFLSYYYLIYPLTISLALFNICEAYAWCLRKTVFSNFLKEVSFRVVTMLITLLYIFKWLSIKQFFWCYSFIYLPAAVTLLCMLIKSKDTRFYFSLSTVTRKLYKKICSFSLFIFSGSILNILSYTLSGIVIASQSKHGLADAGVFAIAVYFISIMEVPQRSMAAITTPVIAAAWKNKDVKQIQELYQKTSLNLLIAGLFIWGLSMINMNNIYAYMGKDYSALKTLVLILGIAKLIDLGTGMNAQIMQLSKHWKLDFICNMAFVFSAIPLNYFFVNQYGVTGSAFATLIAQCFYNLVRFVFIWKFFKLQPFTPKTVTTLLIASACIILLYFLPAVNNTFVDLFLRTLLFITLFFYSMLRLKVSEDISAVFYNVKQKISIRR